MAGHLRLPGVFEPWYSSFHNDNTGMCPGLGEWWLHKGPKFNIYAQAVSRIPCRHFVLCKVASKTKHFHLC